jgi:hypothetical protein
MLIPTLDAEVESLEDPPVENVSKEAERLYDLLNAFAVVAPASAQEPMLLTELEAVHRLTESEIVRSSVFRTICLIAGYGSNREAKNRAREWLKQLTFTELVEKCGGLSAVPHLALFVWLESKPDAKAQTKAIREVTNRLGKWPALRERLPKGIQELFPEAMPA